MNSSIRKETLIVRLWTDVDPVLEKDWRGKVEFIGKGESYEFLTLEELFDWMRRELEKTEGN